MDIVVILLKCLESRWMSLAWWPLAAVLIQKPAIMYAVEGSRMHHVLTSLHLCSRNRICTQGQHRLPSWQSSSNKTASPLSYLDNLPRLDERKTLVADL